MVDIKVIIGSLSYGVVTFNLYSQRFIAPILQLVQFNNDLTTCNIAWNRLNNLLNTKIDVKNGTQTKTIQGNIKFEDVTFYYEEKSLFCMMFLWNSKRERFMRLLDKVVQEKQR